MAMAMVLQVAPRSRCNHGSSFCNKWRCFLVTPWHAILDSPFGPSKTATEWEPQRNLRDAISRYQPRVVPLVINNGEGANGGGTNGGCTNGGGATVHCWSAHCRSARRFPGFESGRVSSPGRLSPAAMGSNRNPILSHRRAGVADCASKDRFDPPRALSFLVVIGHHRVRRRVADLAGWPGLLNGGYRCLLPPPPPEMRWRRSRGLPATG